MFTGMVQILLDRLVSKQPWMKRTESDNNIMVISFWDLFGKINKQLGYKLQAFVIHLILFMFRRKLVFCGFVEGESKELTLKIHPTLSSSDTLSRHPYDFFSLARRVAASMNTPWFPHLPLIMLAGRVKCVTRSAWHIEGCWNTL